MPLHASLVFLPNLEHQFDSWYLMLFLIALRKSYLNSNLLNPLKFSLRDLVHMLSFLFVAAPAESLDTSQLTTWFCKKFPFHFVRCLSKDWFRCLATVWPSTYSGEEKSTHQKRSFWILPSSTCFLLSYLIRLQSSPLFLTAGSLGKSVNYCSLFKFKFIDYCALLIWKNGSISYI